MIQKLGAPSSPNSPCPRPWFGAEGTEVKTRYDAKGVDSKTLKASRKAGNRERVSPFSSRGPEGA